MQGQAVSQRVQDALERADTIQRQPHRHQDGATVAIMGPIMGPGQPDSNGNGNAGNCASPGVLDD